MKRWRKSGEKENSREEKGGEERDEGEEGDEWAGHKASEPRG